MAKRSSSSNSQSAKSSKKPKISVQTQGDATGKLGSSSKSSGKKKSTSPAVFSLKPGTSSKADSTSTSQTRAESSTKSSTVDIEEKYLDTFKSKEEKGPKLNAKERNIEFDNVDDILFSDDERNPKPNASEGEESSSDNMDEDNDMNEDNMLVEDTTHPEKPKGSKKGWSSLKNVKIVEGDFDNLELARLAKACMRLSVCILDMWPKENKATWKLFKKELALIAADGSADEMVQSLDKIRSDFRERQKLIRFRDLVEWLLEESRYHKKEVDTVNRTVVSGPFESPLLGQIFRAYFIESNPSQDQLLVDYLKEKKKIPRRLIVMVTCLICHAIDEWSRGYKSEVNLTRAKVEPHLSYRALWTSMKDLHSKAPTYTAMIQKKLYKEMIADSPLAHPVQKYDYAHLEAMAQAEMKKAKPKEVDSEEETDSDSEDENSSGGDNRESAEPANKENAVEEEA
ncbi:hypothetical protein F5880DRAFT_1503732 [Lentinula raphanica]|nr:hypothetical protein F5880DRAFT_1503732 [Lentinula raphanica]